MADLNGTYYVTDVANDSQLTVTVNGLAPGSVPSADLANAIVRLRLTRLTHLRHTSLTLTEIYLWSLWSVGRW